MSKTEFVKQKLKEKGITDYTEEDIKIIKTEMIDAMHYGRAKEQAIEDAIYVWLRDKRRKELSGGQP